MSGRIIRPGAAEVTSAVVLDDVAKELEHAINKAGAELPDDLFERLIPALKKCMGDHLPGRQPAPVVCAVAIAASCHILADFLAAVQQQMPITDAAIDGRVVAIQNLLTKGIRGAVDHKIRTGQMMRKPEGFA